MKGVKSLCTALALVYTLGCGGDKQTIMERANSGEVIESEEIKDTLGYDAKISTGEFDNEGNFVSDGEEGDNPVVYANDVEHLDDVKPRDTAEPEAPKKQESIADLVSDVAGTDVVDGTDSSINDKIDVAQSPITIVADYYSMDSVLVSDLSIGPDSKCFGYVEKIDGLENIVIYGADFKRREIPNSESSDRDLDIANNCSFVFTTERNGKPEVYFFDDRTKILDNVSARFGGEDINPAVSASERYVVMQHKDGSKHSIRVFDRLQMQKYNFAGNWAKYPDIADTGRTLYVCLDAEYFGNPQICMSSPQDLSALNVSNNDNGFDTMSIITSDGNNGMFYSNINAKIDAYSIDLTNLNDITVKKATAGEGLDGFQAMSANGRYMLYMNKPGFDEGGVLYRYDKAHDVLLEVTNGYKGDILAAVSNKGDILFVKDSKIIYYNNE